MVGRQGGSAGTDVCVCVCECVIGVNEHDDCNFGISNWDTLRWHVCFYVPSGIPVNASMCVCTQVCLNMIVGWQTTAGCRLEYFSLRKMGRGTGRKTQGRRWRCRDPGRVVSPWLGIITSTITITITTP